MAENTENPTKKQANQNILSLFPKFELKLPFFSKEPRQVVEENPKRVTGADGETENISVKPNLVKFPDSNRPLIPAPLEFEAEEPPGRTSNPVVLWQVYALGGFLVLRWVWARWMERKERKEREAKKESSDDNETPADDDDYHST